MPADSASNASSTLATATVRRARADDLDALVALEQASFSGDRLSRRQYRHHLASASAGVLVSATPDVCLGAVVLLFRRGSTLARLYSIAIRAEARGRGLGAALLHAAEAEARARGRTTMRLEVRVDNAAAIGLYERLGYRRIGTCPGYYADGSDAWRYAKPLA